MSLVQDRETPTSVGGELRQPPTTDDGGNRSITPTDAGDAAAVVVVADCDPSRSAVFESLRDSAAVLSPLHNGTPPDS